MTILDAIRARAERRAGSCTEANQDRRWLLGCVDDLAGVVRELVHCIEDPNCAANNDCDETHVAPCPVVAANAALAALDAEVLALTEKFLALADLPDA